MTGLFDLTGKVAVVTGSTAGIGRGVIEQMVNQGARVIVSSRKPDACAKVAADLNARHGGTVAVGIAFDLDDRDDIDRFANDTLAAFGRVDILVANAAVLPFIGPSAATPPADFDRILTRNIHHNFRLAQAFRPAIAAQGGGAVVLIGSIAGHTPNPHLLAYALAKAGVAHLARNLADEFVADRITVNCVAPGFIRSFSSGPIFDNPAALDTIVSGIPMHRAGETDDIAGAVIFLASRAGSYVTGETILVDGGRANLSAPRARDGAAALADARKP